MDNLYDMMIEEINDFMVSYNEGDYKEAIQNVTDIQNYAQMLKIVMEKRLQPEKTNEIPILNTKYMTIKKIVIGRN